LAAPYVHVTGKGFLSVTCLGRRHINIRMQVDIIHINRMFCGVTPINLRVVHVKKITLTSLRNGVIGALIFPFETGGMTTRDFEIESFFVTYQTTNGSRSNESTILVHLDP
jgi:hypothetical protein